MKAGKDNSSESNLEYGAEIGPPILPDGVVLKIKTDNGQELVRGFVVLMAIASRIKEIIENY